MTVDDYQGWCEAAHSSRQIRGMKCVFLGRVRQDDCLRVTALVWGDPKN